MLGKLATALLMFALAALFAFWFIADLRGGASIGAWDVVLYVAAVLVFAAAGIGVLLPYRRAPAGPSIGRGTQVLDDRTVVHDGVVMTVHQVALMDALREASKLGADATVRIGTDPATGQPRYDVVRRT